MRDKEISRKPPVEWAITPPTLQPNAIPHLNDYGSECAKKSRAVSDPAIVI